MSGESTHCPICHDDLCDHKGAALNMYEELSNLKSALPVTGDGATVFPGMVLHRFHGRMLSYRVSSLSTQGIAWGPSADEFIGDTKKWYSTKHLALVALAESLEANTHQKERA